MADEGVGRPLGVSPSTEFIPLSGASASTPSIVITATTNTASQVIHTGDPQATDVVYLQAFNPTANAIVVYANLGNTATTVSIPLTLTAGTGGFLINGLPISGSGNVTVWSTQAASTFSVAGSGQRVYV